MSTRADIDQLVEDIRRDAAASFGMERARSAGSSGEYARGLEDGIRITVRTLLQRAIGDRELGAEKLPA